MSFSIGESPIKEHLKSSQLKVLDEVTKAELNQAIISDVRLTASFSSFKPPARSASIPRSLWTLLHGAGLYSPDRVSLFSLD